MKAGRVAVAIFIAGGAIVVSILVMPVVGVLPTIGRTHWRAGVGILIAYFIGVLFGTQALIVRKNAVRRKERDCQSSYYNERASDTRFFRWMIAVEVAALVAIVVVIVLFGNRG